MAINSSNCIESADICNLEEDTHIGSERSALSGLRLAGSRKTIRSGIAFNWTQIPLVLCDENVIDSEGVCLVTVLSTNHLDLEAKLANVKEALAKGELGTLVVLHNKLSQGTRSILFG